MMDVSSNQHHSNRSRPHCALYDYLQMSSSSCRLSGTFRVITSQCLLCIITFSSSRANPLPRLASLWFNLGPALIASLRLIFGLVFPQFKVHLWPSLSCLTSAQLTSVTSLGLNSPHFSTAMTSSCLHHHKSCSYMVQILFHQ